MMGMDKKMMKKKALAGMIKDGMGISVKIKRGPAQEMMSEDSSAEEKGMEMMMVSPEEKKMILEMRGESEGEMEQEMPEEKQMMEME